MKIHFITYGNKMYEKSKERIRRQAEETGWFDSIKCYGVEDLSKEFSEKYRQVLEEPRGGGYWIWKYDIIRQKMEEVDENDIIIYMDAGCSINKGGKERYDEYIKIIKESKNGIISFMLQEKEERKYTIKEIFEYFGKSVEDEIAKSDQIMATIIIMKKCEGLRRQIEMYKRVLEENVLLFTDKYNKNQTKYFIDNRHDQSIFSIIRKLNNPLIIKDNSWFENFNCKEALKEPFLATRKIEK
jgi:hypothetical protein